MALITGQVICQIGGLVITVDSDDVTGQIAKFTIVNNDSRTFSMTYTRNRNPSRRDIPPGTNLSFTPPQNGVKWLTDDIQWSVS